MASQFARLPSAQARAEQALQQCGLQRIQSSMRTLTLELDNMHCGACVRRVSQTLNALAETHAEEVRVGSALVRTAQSGDALAGALADAGFPIKGQTVESVQP